MSGKTLFQSPEPELTSEPAVRRREKRNVSAVPDAKPLRPAKSADLIPLPLREKPASSRFAVSPIMDELLLGGGGGGEEDARSERSSCGAGDGGGRAKRLESFVRATFGRDVRPALRNFAKRSGLLTLSVVAVLTGCTLGFVLRGTQLSTQDAEDAHPAAHHVQLDVGPVVDGVSGVLPHGRADGDVLPVDDVHGGGGGHRAGGHHQARRGHRHGEQPAGRRARHDLGRRPPGPHQEHGPVQSDRGDVPAVQDGPGANPEGARQVGDPQLRVRGARGGRRQRTDGFAGVDAAAGGDVQDRPGKQPTDERARHRHLLGHDGLVAGQDGRARRAARQRLPVHQRVRHEDHQRRRVVLPVRDRLPGGREDPGHAGPEHFGPEVGLVRRHRPGRPLRARSGSAAPLLLPADPEEPVHVHPRAAAGLGHRPGDLVQLGHVAHHHEVSPGAVPRGPADRPLRAARGRHHQHGRDRPLRGRGRHLHRAGQRLRAGLRAAGHHQHHRHGGQHRRGRHPSGWPGYHGDRADLRGTAPRRHHAHRGHRLDPGPLSHDGQRAGRRLGRGHHRPPVSQGLPPGRRSHRTARTTCP
ncbi:uncharacterized protein slc1a8a isoform X2 [Syngnathoides biaculeatus]|uniref:uncharacterized protein slc1a8a isoform X2 n=1 Tax=Syngnathoides biaculeatus TaxID=300417 RepID=UPI002ADE604A|nr:uncharacterized protein slc1a8a isoform X2 [Syngnathoides biaculeatus]